MVQPWLAGLQEAGKLSLLQRKQLMGAHKQLLDKMEHLMSRRDVAGLTVSSNSGSVPALNSMVQV